MEKEIEALKLQLEQKEKENKELRHLLVIMISVTVRSIGINPGCEYKIG